MFATKLPPSYDNLLDFLVKKATPEEILAFELTPQELQQAEELSDKSKAGHLSEEEAYTLEKMMQTELLIGALRARALAMLKNNDKNL
jgi:hypothetical protein